jgi:hypothetical protein
MKFNFLLLFLLITLLHACAPRKDKKALQPFSQVQGSMEQASAEFQVKFLSLYAGIKSKGKSDPLIAVKADSVFLVTTAAVNYIDSIVKVLDNEPAPDQPAKTTEELLIEPEGNGRLSMKLLQVYDRCQSVVIDSASRAELNQALEGFQDFRYNKEMTRQLFDKTPLQAVKVMLGALKNNCYDGAIVTLQDLKDHLKKQ